MSAPNELIHPTVFLDIPPAQFNHDNYAGHTEQTGIWTIQAELRPGEYTHERELTLLDNNDIVRASLYAWYTTMFRRCFVYMDVAEGPVGTHIFSQDIQDAARDPRAEVVATQLFGTPEMRERPDVGDSDHLVHLPSYDHKADETAEMRLTKEGYRQLILPWVVAGATAMLNEIVHGIKPDNAWVPPVGH